MNNWRPQVTLRVIFQNVFLQHLLANHPTIVFKSGTELSGIKETSGNLLYNFPAPTLWHLLAVQLYSIPTLESTQTCKLRGLVPQDSSLWRTALATQLTHSSHLPRNDKGIFYKLLYIKNTWSTQRDNEPGRIGQPMISSPPFGGVILGVKLHLPLKWWQ